MSSMICKVVVVLGLNNNIGGSTNLAKKKYWGIGRFAYSFRPPPPPIKKHNFSINWVEVYDMQKIWLPGNLYSNSSIVELHCAPPRHRQSLPRHHEKCCLPLPLDQCHSDRSIHLTPQTNFHYVGTLLGLKREHTREVENSEVVIQSRRTHQMRHFQYFVMVVNYFRLTADLGKG